MYREPRRPARPLAWRFCALLAGSLLAGSLGAHEVGGKAIPGEPGLAISAAVAAAWLNAPEQVPALRLPGVLGMGDTPDDQRGWRLEHATLAAGLRATPRWGATVAVGWHDGEAAHVEAAWAEWRRSADAELSLGFGRTRVPLGPLISEAGHFDRYGQMPLAKRAAFNGDWIEDGVNLSWRPHLDGAFGWLDTLDFGFWRARRFPGSADISPMPVLHLRAVWGDVTLDGFYGRLRPTGRGAYSQRMNSGHIHTAPSCAGSLRDITCFDGRADLLGASVGWQTPVSGLALSAAGIVRRERGELYSQNGDTRYSGRSQGGWLEALWTPDERWAFGLRQEWLRGNHRLAGPGAALVAAEAGLTPNHASRRSTAMASWQPVAGWRIAFEAGREHAGGQGITVVGMRVIWTPEPLYERSWK